MSDPAASQTSSAVTPLIAGLVASGGVFNETDTGTAVLIVLGGGAFLLSIVVNFMKLRAYSKGDRNVEAKAQAADLVSRQEMENKTADLRAAITHLRDTVTNEISDLTRTMAESTADMQNALGRLQGQWEASNAGKGVPRR